jgi:preprotein translocase subunit SecE
MNLVQKPIQFLREVKQELSKVSWSTRKEVLGATVVVLLITAIMSAYIGVVDYALAKALSVMFR